MQATGGKHIYVIKSFISSIFFLLFLQLVHGHRCISHVAWISIFLMCLQIRSRIHVCCHLFYLQNWKFLCHVIKLIPTLFKELWVYGTPWELGLTAPRISLQVAKKLLSERSSKRRVPSSDLLHESKELLSKWSDPLIELLKPPSEWEPPWLFTAPRANMGSWA